jgi:hypothetical protein
MSVVVRASVDDAVDGRLVAVVEAVDTGERRAVSDVDELMAWIQVGANRRAALDDVAVDQPDASERQSDG